MCDAVYYCPISNLKHWYTPYEDENEGSKPVSLNTVNITKVKVKLINTIALSYTVELTLIILIPCVT